MSRVRGMSRDRRGAREDEPIVLEAAHAEQRLHQLRLRATGLAECLRGLRIRLAARGAAHLVDELAHGQEPLRRAAVERAHDHGFHRRRDQCERARQLDDRVRVRAVHLVRAPRVHGLAREHVVVERAERVQVRALIHGLAVDLFRRHELGHPGNLVAARLRHRQREVDELDVARASHGRSREQHVLRRQIAMHDAHLGGLDDRLADDLDQLRGLRERNRAAGADRLGKGMRALDELVCDPRLLASGGGPLAGRHHLGDARALDALELLQLALEPRAHARQRGHAGGNDLDRDGSLRRDISCAVDHARARTTDAGTDRVLCGERISTRGRRFERDQPRGIDRAEVRVIAEMLLALWAELHRLIPRIIWTSSGERNLAQALVIVERGPRRLTGRTTKR